MFDFATLNDKCDAVIVDVNSVNNEIELTKNTFKGIGSNGAMEGFLFAFGLILSVMFALGMINALEHYDVLSAARKLLTPIIQPIIGLPGSMGLAMIGSFQSTDVGPSLTRSLSDQQ